MKGQWDRRCAALAIKRASVLNPRRDFQSSSMAGNDRLRTWAVCDSMDAMKLTHITANRHIVDGLVNGKPLRLLFAFDGDVTLRLQVAEDGERMVLDDGPLDAPLDMDEYGQVDIAEVTEALFPTLRGLIVTDVNALARNGSHVGLKLSFTGCAPFYFWVDGDELHWGDEAALVGHDWLDGRIPSVSERINV